MRIVPAIKLFEGPRRVGGSILPSIALAAVVAGGLSLYVPRQFDLHHTGLIAAALVAVGDGHPIHLDVFSQYGPLLTWTQVPFLVFGFSPIITLHVWAVVVTSLIAFLIADLGRISPQRWGLPRSTTFVAAGLWVVLDPTWRTGYLNAWSSLLVALLLVTSLYLFAIASRGGWPFGVSIIRSASLFGSGMLVGLSPFARVNAGLAAIFVLLTVLVVGEASRNNRGTKMSRWMLAGLVSGLVLPVAVLLASGSLSYYWDQAIVGPLLWANSALEPGYWNTWSGLQDRLLAAGNRMLPLLLLLLLALFLATNLKRRGLVPWSRLFTIGALSLFGVLMFYITGIVDLTLRFLREREISLLNSYDEISLRVYQGGLYFFIFGFLMLSAIQLFKIIYKIRRQGGGAFNEDIFDLLLWGYGLALLVQIVPTYDNRHAWWGICLVILAFLRFLHQASPSLLISRVIAVTLFLAFLAPTAAEASQQLSIPLRAAPTNSIGAGAFVEPEIAIEIESQLEISRIVSSSSSFTPTYYMVRDGSVAVIDGVYRSSYREYVWWASKPSITEINSVPWGALVIDSWTSEFLGFSTIADFVAELSPDYVSCTSSVLPTIYCIVSR